MAAPVNLTELLRPIEQAISARKGGGVISLDLQDVLMIREALPDLRRQQQDVLSHLQQVLHVVRAAPNPAMKLFACNDQVPQLEEKEQELKKSFDAMLQHLRSPLDDVAKELLHSILETTTTVLEAYRDTRWELMAIRAENRPSSEVRLRSSIAELRRAIAARS